jgi:hypothetical protein
MNKPPLNMNIDKYDLDTLSDAEIYVSQDFIKLMLDHVARGETLASFYRQVSPSLPLYVSQTRLRLTLSLGDVSGPGVVALQEAYQRARAGFIDSKFDELFDVFDSDAIKADPRLASAAKGKSDNIKWALGKLRPAEYGDKIQIEQSVDVTIVDRLQAGRERAALIDNDTESNKR